MHRSCVSLVLLAAVTAPGALPANAAEAQPSPESGAPRYVMLKLDDLKAAKTASGVPVRWQRVADYLASKGLKSGFGIICNSLEGENAAYTAWIRQRAIENGGLIEFWHHGYDHAMNFELNGVRHVAEFSGPSYEHQADHFSRAFKLMQEKTGITLRTFGTPGNQSDDSTLRVLEENPEVKVWLYGSPKAATKMILKRTLNLEYAVGRVSVEKFQERYPQRRSDAYLVLQGHPAMWDEASFAAFQSIVELLVGDGWQFITPYEYYLKQQGTAGR